MRSRAPSLPRIEVTWFLTVPSARHSRSPISRLLRPAARRRTISRSRSEKGSGRPAPGGRAGGASRANSAIVHAGYDPPAGTLMASMNVAGNAMFAKMCGELSVPYKNNGSLICALSDDEKPKLADLLANGRKNGVPKLEILSRSEVHALEPNLAPGVAGALYARTGGIVGAYELTTALAENGVVNGGCLKLNFEVQKIWRIKSADGGFFELVSSDGRALTARG